MQGLTVRQLQFVDNGLKKGKAFLERVKQGHVQGSIIDGQWNARKTSTGSDVDNGGSRFDNFRIITR